MSSPVSLLAQAATTRRTLLSALTLAAGGVVAGCTAGVDGAPGSQPDRSAPPQPALDPDVTVATLALSAERAALDLVLATRERHGDWAAALSPLVTSHEQHVAMLADAVPDDSTSPSPESPSSPSPTPSGPGPVAGDPRRALRDLVRAERQLATSLKRHAFVAESGTFARLLASMAASAAQHEVVLETVSVDGGAQ